MLTLGSGPPSDNPWTCRTLKPGEGLDRRIHCAYVVMCTVAGTWTSKRGPGMWHGIES